MLLILGLGNPGKNYDNTPHNAGFLFIDYLIEKDNIILNFKKKLNSHIGVCDLYGVRCILAKSDSYMNLTGNSVRNITDYYSINSKNVFIIHDDIDLKFGIVKYKFAGGDAGHNGLRSITSLISNQYHRLRIGVGRPENNNINIADYVTSSLDKNKFEDLKLVCKNFIDGDHFEKIIKNDIVK